MPRRTHRGPSSTTSRSSSNTDRSASNRKKGSLTGSGRLFRAYSPTNCRGPAATTRSGSSGSPGHELPVGFSTADLFGGPRIAVNCAFCHTSAYRLDPAGPRTLVTAGPGNLVNPQAYVRFLHSVADDPRFNAGELLKTIDGLTNLSWMRRMQYRMLLIPGTRRALQRQKKEFAWMDRNPDWGAGRIDPFNPIRFRLLKQPIDTSIGNADMMPLWNMKGRTAIHWDGLTTSFHESMLSSGIGNGASRKSIGLASLGRLEQWLMELPSPRYPLAIDASLAASGEPVFAQHCASCHAPGGARTGSVVPIGEIGTDAHRVNMWTQESAAAFNAFADGYPWDFKAFRKTNGYVAVPLDGVWLRGPVSSQRFGPIAARPARAGRESPKGVLSRLRRSRRCRASVSYRRPCSPSGSARVTTPRLPGNGNGGHPYGTDLTGAQKRALLEFLKTL